MTPKSPTNKHVVLFFGTFNPIHIGHLIMAQHVAQLPDVDETWLVVSPKNPLKEKRSLLADHHRLYMTKIAVENNPLLRVSDIEFSLPKPSYTAFTLVNLREKFPHYTFSLLMGEDNLHSLHKWKNYEEILRNHQILIYPREKNSIEPEKVIPDILKVFKDKINFLDLPLLNISATYIRNQIKANKSIKYLVNAEVEKYLDEMAFYR